MQDHFYGFLAPEPEGRGLGGVGWVPEPPPQSLQLVNMKPRAGRSWPLSCQRIAHLESHKAFLGAPRSWPRSLPPCPVGSGLLF